MLNKMTPFSAVLTISEIFIKLVIFCSVQRTETLWSEG